MKHRVKAFAFFIFLSIFFKFFAQTGCISIPNVFNNLHITQGQAYQAVPKGGMNITAPGAYHMVEPVTGFITIQSSDVLLEMNGFTLSVPSGTIISKGTPLLIIDEDLTNVVVQDGAFFGGDVAHGVSVKQGACAIVLRELNFLHCVNGLELLGLENKEVSCCKIQHCFFSTCQKGVALTNTTMSVFEDCDTCCCSLASFDLVNCAYNKFKQCKAVRTGNDIADESAYGFSTVGGVDNLFCECMAEGIYKGGALGCWCTKAVGFNLGFNENKVPESESKIINCLVDSVQTTSLSAAYGIQLDMALKDTITSEIATGNIINQDTFVTDLDWSPDCKHIAVGSRSSSSFFEPIAQSAYLQILKFNGDSLHKVYEEEFASIQGDPPYFLEPRNIRFSPDGRFLAVTIEALGENNISRFLIYNVADFTKLIDETVTAYPFDLGSDGQSFYNVQWFHCERRLAISKTIVSANSLSGSIEVYLFDGNNTLTLSNTITFDSIVRTLDISPDDRYIAFTLNNGELQVVDANSLDVVATLSNINVPVNSFLTFNPIACCKKYYIATFDAIIEFDVQENTLKTIATLELGGRLKWYSTGKYLAVLPSNVDALSIFSFNPQNDSVLSSEPVLAYNSFAIGSGGIFDWSPCARFLVLVGNPHIATQIDFEIVELGNTVKNCFIDCNKVANTKSELCSLGIFGCSCCNGIVNNVAYENCVNFSQDILNVWCQGAAAIDQLHFNVSIAPY